MFSLDFDVLILDEPLLFLDSKGRDLVISLIKNLKVNVKTTFGGNALRNSKFETLVLTSDNMSVLQGTLGTNTPIVDGTGYIYVPANLLEDYKSATNWVTYADQFRAIEDHPEVLEVSNND